MFDYPLPIPSNTVYQRLGVTPAATPEDVREAKNRAAHELGREQASVQAKLNAVYAQVDGLREACEEEQKLRTAGRPDDEDRLREVQERLSMLLRRANRIDPDFRRHREDAADLDRRINDVNRIDIDNPEARRQYDAATPPLGLLACHNAAEDVFADQRNSLFLLRRDLADFLRERGEAVYHPSDLTRRDFSADFTPNRLLDGDHQ